MTDVLADLIAHADEMADRCERTVPHTSGHAAAVAALHAAGDERARTAAVGAARADGMSWAAIAVVLDLPTAECHRRYPRADDDPLEALVPDAR